MEECEAVLSLFAALVAVNGVHNRHNAPLVPKILAVPPHRLFSGDDDALQRRRDAVKAGELDGECLREVSSASAMWACVAGDLLLHATRCSEIADAVEVMRSIKDLHDSERSRVSEPGGEAGSRGDAFNETELDEAQVR